MAMLGCAFELKMVGHTDTSALVGLFSGGVERLAVAKDGTSTSPGMSPPRPLDFLLRWRMLSMPLPVERREGLRHVETSVQGQCVERMKESVGDARYDGGRGARK
jgi:hypothetical protein